MSRVWNSVWKASSRPRVQRLFRAVAPKHFAGRFLNAHLSKELREKLKTRSIRVRKGDSVRVLSGSFSKRDGVVERVDVKNGAVFIGGVDRVKKNGGKVPYPIIVSRIVITGLKSDPRRSANAS